MHVILATLGTDGDVFPHIGLATVLRSRGHRVTLAAPEPYRDRALALGLEFCSLVTTAEVDRMVADPDLWHPLRSGRMMARWGNPMIPRQYELLVRLAQDPTSVFVANPGVLAARLVQEKLSRPTASLLLQPGLVPSSIAPPEMPGGLTIPKWLPPPLREFYWQAVDGAAYFLIARRLNAIRASLELSPVYRTFRWWLSPDLVIALFPPSYATPQLDWPRQIRLAGFGRFDGSHGNLPDEVRAFCENGEPPVAFTLGTGMTHAAHFFRTAVQACAAIGARGILLTRHANQVPEKLPSSIIHCRFAPFRLLLPYCGAIVHHGGIGTTAAALESGCPQLLLPLAWDQPDNAARVTRMGVGLSVGTRQRTSKHLSYALLRLMSAEVRAQCRKAANQIGKENGLEVAANWLEEFAAGLRTSWSVKR